MSAAPAQKMVSNALARAVAAWAAACRDWAPTVWEAPRWPGRLAVMACWRRIANAAVPIAPAMLWIAFRALAFRPPCPVRRGWPARLGRGGDAPALDQLRTTNQLITASPALLAREQHALNQATIVLVGVLAVDTAAAPVTMTCAPRSPRTR
jgi:hypothetical protein